MVEEPAIGQLASAVGLAPIIWMVLSLVVRNFLPETTFNRFAPALAVLLGIILAEAYVLVTTTPITGPALLQGLLVGLFAGSLSQNFNNMVARAQGNSPTPVA